MRDRMRGNDDCDLEAGGGHRRKPGLAVPEPFDITQGRRGYTPGAVTTHPCCPPAGGYTAASRLPLTVDIENLGA
jgi:hypothetical protein